MKHREEETREGEHGDLLSVILLNGTVGDDVPHLCTTRCATARS
jgi:hypothetical protein